MQNNHENKMLKTYTTKRFIIRPLLEEDREFYVELYGNEKVVKHICKPLSQTKAERAFNLTLMQHQTVKPKILAWIIIDKSSSEKIGFQALTWYLHKEAEYDALFCTNGEPEVGVLLKSDAQGKGFAVEAMGSLIEYAYTELNIKNIHLFYYKTHTNTIKFLAKLGAVLDVNIQPLSDEWEYQYIKKENWQKSLIESVT